MRGLVPYAWRSLAARPGRTLLSAAGVAIGVGVLVASLAVTAGLDASIERTVGAVVGRSDIRVAAFTEQGLSAESLAALEGVPGISISAPAIERRTFLAATPGRAPSTQPVVVLGIDPLREPRVHELPLVAGAPLAELDEAAALVPERLAAAEGLRVGDELGLLGRGAPLRVRIVGILQDDGPEIGASGRTVVLPIRTAARLALADGDALADGIPGGIARIDVVLAAGATADGVIAALGSALVTEPYVISVPRDIAASMRASTAEIRATMALLAAITLFAAAFIILNTLGMTVVERIRELALLRAAGSTRGQSTRVVLLQALVLGVAGALLGLALGAGLGLAVAAWLRATGAATLEGPVFTPLVLATGPIAGIVITLLASFEPARRAAAVSPVAALQVRADPTAAVRGHAGWLVILIAFVAAVGTIALPAALSGRLGAVRPLAVYGVLLAAALATPVLVGPVGRLVGLPFSLVLRLEERLARAALSRDRGRTTLTAGALIVGLAMVVGLGVVAANSRIAATAWLADVVPGDEILTAIVPEPLGSGSVLEEVTAVDGVVRATPIASFDLAFSGNRLESVAVVGADLAADGRLSFLAGDRETALAGLDAGGTMILPRARALRLGIGLGDVVAVLTNRGLVELEVTGIVERSFPARTGEAALVGWGDATERFGIAGADAIVVRYDPALRDGAAAAVEEIAVRRALTASPISRVEGAVGDALDRVFGLLDLIALAAVAIAGLGIVNTISMDTLERARELAMLRALGMSRRQVFRSVIVEAGIIGGVGAAVGCVAGLAVGAILLVTGDGLGGRPLEIPWGVVGLAFVLGIALAMLAAAQPARLAGRRSIVGVVRGE